MMKTTEPSLCVVVVKTGVPDAFVKLETEATTTELAKILEFVRVTV